MQGVRQVEHRRRGEPRLAGGTQAGLRLGGADRRRSVGSEDRLALGQLRDAGAATARRAVVAQRRIDLLAIEQNAWVLAARDPRCVVVATRTEIDWAMKHGQTIVWAPSKLVLDAVDGPHSREPVALALWLAELTAADGFVVHGSVTVPAGSRVTIERA